MDITGGLLFCFEMGGISECLFAANDPRQRKEAFRNKYRERNGRMQEGVEIKKSIIGTQLFEFPWLPGPVFHQRADDRSDVAHGKCHVVSKDNSFL